jgi:outer membrane murein-binding lipoprotein Lpp
MVRGFRVLFAILACAVGASVLAGCTSAQKVSEAQRQVKQAKKDK